MNGGYIKLFRKFFENELWLEEREFSRAEAWIDLLQVACYMPSSRLIKGKSIKLDVGDLIASERFLSERWNWGRQKVRDFLKYLKKNHRITHRITQNESIISIVNYASYNNEETESNPPNNPPSNPPTTHPQPKYKEGKEGKEIRESDTRARGFNPQIIPPTLEQVVEMGRQPDIGLDAEACTAFFNSFTSNSWHDKFNNPITNWPAKLRAVGSKFKKGKSNYGTSNNLGGRPNRNAGTYNDPDRQRNGNEPF